MAENAAAGTSAGRPMSATDPDSTQTVTYTLEAFTGHAGDLSSFEIDSSTGQITTSATASLDFETKSTYIVTVKATDDGSPVASATVPVTIRVIDVNEAPTISGDAAVPRYFENDTSVVATYTAADPEGDSFTWGLSGDDAGDFTIDSGGRLNFKTPPDRNNPADSGSNNVYNVNVTATDAHRAASQHAVTVTIYPVIEGPAHITHLTQDGRWGVGEFTVHEPSPTISDWRTKTEDGG